jgi:cullin-associated NEDD8-dissociated protein 1
MRHLTLLSDMSIQHGVFDNAIDHFSAEEEEIRTAAAFAAGECNIVAVSVLR